MSTVIKNLVKGLSVDERTGEVFTADIGKGNAQKNDNLTNVVKGSTFPVTELTYIGGEDAEYIVPADMEEMYLSKGNKVSGLPKDEYLIENWKLTSVSNTKVANNRSGGRKKKITLKEAFKRNSSDTTPVDSAKATLNAIMPLELEGYSDQKIGDLKNIIEDIENNKLNYDGLFYLLSMIGVKSELIIGGKNSGGISLSKIYVKPEID